MMTEKEISSGCMLDSNPDLNPARKKSSYLGRFAAEHTKSIAIGLFAIGIFILVWHIGAIYINKEFVPAPDKVFSALVDSFQNQRWSNALMHQHIAYSLVRVFYGFAVAVILAVPLGLFMGWSIYAYRAANPIIEILRQIPPLAWIPFAIIAFRDPDAGAAFIVFLGIFFPLLLSTIAGVRAIDTQIIDAARTLGARGLSLFTKVIFPATVPHIMTGIKVGLGIGWMCIVAAEMVGVSGGGLGWYIWEASGKLQYDYMFAGMIVIGIVGLAMIIIVSRIQKILSKWWGLE